jgi:SAM-dependent methyltransferase
MADETRAFYDLNAERIADEWYANDVLLPTIQDFLTLLPAKPKILDLGCGPGYESMRLHAEGAEVLGVDFSPENIRIARERCPQCRFVELDFRQLDNRWGTFDGVFASASLIHIPRAELPEVLDKIAGVLSGRGKLLMIVQDGEGTRESWPEVNGRKLRRIIHLYSKAALESLAGRFRLMRGGYLASELVEAGWRCYVFRDTKN